MGGWTEMQDLKMKDEMQGPENAGPQKQDRKMKYKVPKARLVMLA